MLLYHKGRVAVQMASPRIAAEGGRPFGCARDSACAIRSVSRRRTRSLSIVGLSAMLGAPGRASGRVEAEVEVE